MLPGLLTDLARRCDVIRQDLRAASTESDVASHALSAYREVTRIRRDVGARLADPTLGEPRLAGNHLQEYRRWSESVSVVEAFVLPFVARFNADDRRLTHLCGRITAEIRWPLPAPLVATISSEYYWTFAPGGVVAVPHCESRSLLGLPDLFHELGHGLAANQERALIGEFRRELRAYVDSERRRAARAQRSSSYDSLLDLLLVQWSDRWIPEFVADMVATYLVGCAFGWQHIRLCASHAPSAFHPGLGESADHPADDARLQGIVRVLYRIGDGGGAQSIDGQWKRYVCTSGETRPAEYDLCYPPQLIESLAERVLEGCATLGLRPANESATPAGGVVQLLNESWERFRADPGAYHSWEDAQLAALLV